MSFLSLLLFLLLLFFFFKQKTAYEMRISDWSSDVCSSDLIGDLQRALASGDSAMIARANGVGPKLAQRITHELKDKAGALGGIAGSAPALAVTPGPLADAVTALTGLGFKPGEASAAVAAAGAELGADASLDALVRVALKKAAK